MVSFSKMSIEELRAYNREAQQLSRARTVASARCKHVVAKVEKPEPAEVDGAADVEIGAGIGSAVISHRPTPEMLEDALRRSTAPRPAISWLMGDPAPGQSALDKRRQERAA